MILVKPSHHILQISDFDNCNDQAYLQIIEHAGRTCYKSKISESDEERQKFVKMIMDRGHESVIEHSSMTVEFVCDRGVSHELVRHRLCAFSQESTRYVNYKGGCTFVIPPWILINEQNIVNAAYLANPKFENITGDARTWLLSMQTAESHYSSLLADGWSPQQARSVLPNSTKTEIVVTTNFREWRHIFKLRTSKAAHPQMREIMIPLLVECRELIPVIFDDIMEE